MQSTFKAMKITLRVEDIHKSAGKTNIKWDYQRTSSDQHNFLLITKSGDGKSCPENSKRWVGGEHVKKVESSGIGIKLINYSNSQGILRLRKHPATETLRCFAFAFEGGKTNLLTNEEISKCYISEWWNLNVLKNSKSSKSKYVTSHMY